MTRRDARRHVFILIYQAVFHSDEDFKELLQLYFDELPTELGNEKEFVTTEFLGTMDNLEDIDRRISEHSLGWAFDRIAKIDLSIMRLAVYEIFYNQSIPESVAVNEAVELCKEFGTDESYSFVNGVLGAIIKGKAVQ